MKEKRTMSGGEAIVRTILANDIDVVYGIPGAQIYPLFDALAVHEVPTIVPRHEQGAAYMALGHARSTGRPSAFAVVPGPGVLNTSAALCTAYGTCSPVLCLTGQVPSAYLGSGRGHLHELPDQRATLKSFLKDAFSVADPAMAPTVVSEALKVAAESRPGPVSVEMCWDDMAQVASVDVPDAPLDLVQPVLNEDALRSAAQLLQSAKRPLIMCGAGAQHASEAVQALAELLNAPVTAFRSGRGVVAEDHPLGVSSVAARLLFDEVDLVLGIGSRLEMIYMRWRDMMRYERKPLGPKLIRVDIDPAEFARLEPDVAVHGDADAACRALYDLLAPAGSARADRLGEIQQAKFRARRLCETIQPQMAYLDVIRACLPRDGFFVPEVSQTGFTSFFGFPVYEPRTYVSEGYQGTLGFGFQTALGVKVANPERAVVCATGDGGFMFGVQELATAAEYGIAVVTIVFNNASYGNVLRDQMTAFEGRVIGARRRNPDFAALAEIFGVRGFRAENPEVLARVLPEALALNAPCVIEVPIAEGAESSPWPLIHMPEPPAAP